MHEKWNKLSSGMTNARGSMLIFWILSDNLQPMDEKY